MGKLVFHPGLKVLGLGFLFLLPNFGLFGQSGWTKAKMEGFYQLSFNTLSSDRYFTLEGEKLITNSFHQNSVVFYGEYGLTNRFTLIANWPLQVWNGFSTTETVSGLGDLRLEFKHALLKKYIPLSISVAPEFPIGRSNHFAKSKSNDFEFINLPSGDGEFNIWTTLATSFSLPTIPFYGNFYGALNLRTAYQDVQLSDQVSYGMELGYQLPGKIWLNGRLNTLKSLDEVRVATDFVRGDGTEFTSYSFGASIPIYNQIHLSLNYRNYGDFLVQRRNLYSAATFSVGLFLQTKPNENE